MKQTVLESTLGVNYSEGLKAKGMGWEPMNVAVVSNAMIASIADFLAAVKSKDHKVSLEIQDYHNNTKLVGIVSYTPSEDEDAPGEWNLVFTFDPSQIEDGTQRYTIHDTFFQNVAMASSYRETGLSFNQITFMVDMFSVMAEEIYKWLDINAKDGEVVELEEYGYFLAQVSVEQGEKHFSLIPSEEMKQKVKSDASENVI